VACGLEAHDDLPRVRGCSLQELVAHKDGKEPVNPYGLEESAYEEEENCNHACRSEDVLARGGVEGSCGDNLPAHMPRDLRAPDPSACGQRELGGGNCDGRPSPVVASVVVVVVVASSSSENRMAEALAILDGAQDC